MLDELTESRSSKAPGTCGSKACFLRVVSSKAWSTSTANFCCVFSSMHLHVRRPVNALAYLPHRPCHLLRPRWLAHARHHPVHLQLNCRVVQAVMEHLACQPLEILRVRFDKLSSASARFFTVSLVPGVEGAMPLDYIHLQRISITIAVLWSLITRVSQSRPRHVSLLSDSTRRKKGRHSSSETACGLTRRRGRG